MFYLLKLAVEATLIDIWPKQRIPFFNNKNNIYISNMSVRNYQIQSDLIEIIDIIAQKSTIKSKMSA